MTDTKKKILLINGPNLNLLGTREPELYGTTTLAQVETALVERAARHNLELDYFQSNHEGHILDRIHQARTEGVTGIILNPAGLSHSSVAMRDALLGVAIPYIEIHITNRYQREKWRHQSHFSDKAEAVITGLGVFGYVASLDWWAWKLEGSSFEALTK
ncbi:hypothetical protein SEUCBS139899_003119 [Sporothrix eucalyptigena]|uniref:Catabolic 3-dehydroquinase n=1 Tax=Sporothrix eucalyptigena TaxID=1812306 RepID=A0ABP0AZ68_9PEZI